MNPTVIKIGIGVVCAAVTILYAFWKNYKEGQRCQQALEGYPSFDEDNVSICCICLADFSNKTDIFSLPCKHRFHRSCITLCLENGFKRCPLCRRVVSNDYFTKSL